MTFKYLRNAALFAAAQSFALLAATSFAQDPAPAPAAPAAKPPAQSQQTPKPAQARPTDMPTIIRLNPTLVVLPVTVKDRRGTLVPDLKKDEFRVFEDNVEQQVLDFTIEAFPISLVVVIDNDLKSKDADQVEPSLRSIVGGLSTSDETFVCRFDQFFYPGKGFTKDQDKLLTELRRTEIASHSSVPPPGGPFDGPTINNQPAPGAPMNPAGLKAIKGQSTKALDDAVYAAAELLKDRPRERRKVILLISDGQNGAKFNNHSYDDTLAELLRHNISVYSVATGSSYFDRKFSRLVSYSKDTGGDIYYGAKSNTFEEFYSRITEQARNQYTLTFAPKGERKVDYHTLEVRVRREGLTILTREGYYGGTFATEAPK
ncbi:MAG TPA: VWA domain-containing protein [Candidatus Acidoferrum sp.]